MQFIINLETKAQLISQFPKEILFRSPLSLQFAIKVLAMPHSTTSSWFQKTSKKSTEN
jgi:hypothetical protein